MSDVEGLAEEITQRCWVRFESERRLTWVELDSLLDWLAARVQAACAEALEEGWDEGFNAARGHLSDYYPNPHRPISPAGKRQDMAWDNLPIAENGVHLTDDEREALLHVFGFQFRAPDDHERFSLAIREVERIIATRVTSPIEGRH